MFAKGLQPGSSFKADALALLPAGARCKRVSAMGITGYEVYLPDGSAIAAAGTADRAWREALAWAHAPQPESPAPHRR